MIDCTSMSKILVIGGAGFIGSNLAETLVKEHQVIVVDNLFLGKEENLKDIKDEITFHNADYTEEALMKKLITENNIEYVYHFGGYSSAPMFEGKEVEGFDVNVLGFVGLLRACLGTSVKRVLYASTSSIYGDTEIQNEDAKVAPPNFYSATKYSMEHAARLFWEIYGLESIGFLFFSVYGKKEEHKGKFANLVSQFMWNIKENTPVDIYGDGTQTRDFTYVKDIVNALSLGMNTKSKFAQGSFYNIGTSESYSLNDMVKILEEELGEKANKEYIEIPIKNYVEHTLASIEKIQKDFGYQPEFSLQKGIKDMIQ